MTRSGYLGVVLASALATFPAGGAVLAMTSGPAPAPAPHAAAPADPSAKGAGANAATDSSRESAVPDEAANARNAARTRMRECGHQWSSMKKSGAANGLTWKDFSQGCLARK